LDGLIERMGGWMVEYMDECVDGWMLDGWMNGYVDGWMDGKINVRINGKMNVSLGVWL
jgi:hypothetical protein